MKRHILIFIFFAHVQNFTFSQNLVNNPGFEIFQGKGIAYSNDMSKARFWTGLNTADYFNANKSMRPNYEYRRQLVYAWNVVIQHLLHKNAKKQLSFHVVLNIQKTYDQSESDLHVNPQIYHNLQGIISTIVRSACKVYYSSCLCHSY